MDSLSCLSGYFFFCFFPCCSIISHENTSSCIISFTHLLTKVLPDEPEHPRFMSCCFLSFLICSLLISCHPRLSNIWYKAYFLRNDLVMPLLLWVSDLHPCCRTELWQRARGRTWSPLSNSPLLLLGGQCTDCNLVCATSSWLCWFSADLHTQLVVLKVK